MKTLRICLLVLLAVLLPVRGAMAAAMLCPAMGEGPHAVQMHDAEDDAVDDGMAAEMAAEAHDSMPAGCHEHASSTHDDASQCKLCCAFCSLTPLPGGLPGLPAPQHFSAAAFPEPLSPAPSFVSGGPERPPKPPAFPRV